MEKGRGPDGSSPLPLIFALKTRDQMNFMIHRTATPGRAG